MNRPPIKPDFILPTPSPIEQDLSRQLLAEIIKEINEYGPISFARYMELALYAPDLGYYRNGLKKFGPTGDFTTAPEISPLFSKCIARQCREILQQLGGGDILEFGPGSGVMAAVILKTLAQQNALPNHYYLLELSAELKDRQYKTIAAEAPEFLSRVIWLQQLPKTPFRGVVLANEVLDAMPVYRFGFYQGLKEFLVKHDENGLSWALSKPSTHLIQPVLELEVDFAEGYTSEINLYLAPWIKNIAELLTEGVILITDYGMAQREYYHKERACGTFVCHYHHLVHDNPFWWPGIQDITSQVDFTAVAIAATNHDLDVAGYIHQAGFLLSLGITEEMNNEHAFKNHHILAEQIKRLTLPQEMGEAFKAIALTKNYDHPLLGFAWMNQIERL